MPIPTNKVFRAPPQGEIAIHVPAGKLKWPNVSYEATTIRARKRTKKSKNPKVDLDSQELRNRLFGER